ncbi:hypothetical protein [Alsobacter sp. SYSU BS001988]
MLRTILSASAIVLSSSLSFAAGTTLCAGPVVMIGPDDTVGQICQFKTFDDSEDAIHYSQIPDHVGTQIGDPEKDTYALMAVSDP